MQNLCGDPNVRNLHLYLHLCEYTSNTKNYREIFISATIFPRCKILLKQTEVKITIHLKTYSSVEFKIHRIEISFKQIFPRHIDSFKKLSQINVFHFILITFNFFILSENVNYNIYFIMKHKIVDK